MSKRILTYIVATSALLMASCTSEHVIEEVPVIVDKPDLMRFSGINDQTQITRTDNTIPNLLKQNFMVSCYKSFGSSNQQEVMPMYEVNYEPYTASNGEQTSWNYISADTDHMFYQTQYEKYWDYSAFPYRFSAVTPAPVQNQKLAAGFELTDQHLFVPARFEYQTCTNGICTSGAEPCMVAQVSRMDDGRDFDLLAHDDDDPSLPKEINTASQTLNRSVALPFHHLNSKVRFGIYCPKIGEGEEHEVIDVKIKVRSAQFSTSAQYEADLTTGSMMDGLFVDRSTADDVLLLEVSPGVKQTGNELYHLDEQPAPIYWFECQNGLFQVPQMGVKLSISFKVKGRFLDEKIEALEGCDFDGEYTELKDIPITLKDTQQEIFDWEKNHYYTYYIVLGEFTTTTPQYPIVDGPGGIYFTCVVEPWEEVKGSMGVGLED